MEVIPTAMVSASSLIGQEGRLGVIMEGVIANILILEEIPLTSTSSLVFDEANYIAILKEGPIHKLDTSKVDIKGELFS
jgi:imidazolonepropionase-like amidohydrolase